MGRALMMWLAAASAQAFAGSGAHAFAVGVPAHRRTDAVGRCPLNLQRGMTVLRPSPIMRDCEGSGYGEERTIANLQNYATGYDEERLAKLADYAREFSREGIHGDMRKYNVIKVASGRDDQRYTNEDRLTKAERYSTIFAQTMSGTSRAAAVGRIIDDLQT